METLLKTLEDAEDELAKIMAKIEGISTAGLSTSLTEKRDRLLAKDKELDDAIMKKKIEIFRIIMPFAASILPEDDAGYYASTSTAPDVHLSYGKNPDEVGVKSTSTGEVVTTYCKIEAYMQKFEHTFYKVCNNVINDIENHVSSLKGYAAGEFDRLTEIRAKFAKLKLK